MEPSDAAAKPRHADRRHRRHPASRDVHRQSRHHPRSRDQNLLTRRWASQAWITCVCEFRGRRREVMGGRSWTELFFLDEATALAAGHRPCFYCRRDDANRFRAAWEAGQRRRRCSRARRSMPCCIASGSMAAASGGTRCRCRCSDCPMARCCRRARDLSDRAGPGASVVVRQAIATADRCDRRRAAADAALDAARVGGGISCRCCIRARSELMLSAVIPRRA